MTITIMIIFCPSCRGCVTMATICDYIWLFSIASVTFSWLCDWLWVAYLLLFPFIPTAHPPKASFTLSFFTPPCSRHISFVLSAPLVLKLDTPQPRLYFYFSPSVFKTNPTTVTTWGPTNVGVKHGLQEGISELVVSGITIANNSWSCVMPWELVRYCWVTCWKKIFVLSSLQHLSIV